MNFLKHDLDRFTKALNIQGFELVCLLDKHGIILAEKSTQNFDVQALSSLVAALVYNSSNLSSAIGGGNIETIAIEMASKNVLLSISPELMIFGIPKVSTPLLYARNELSHALHTLM